MVFELPPGYRTEFGGEAAEQGEAVGNLLVFVPLLTLVMVAALVLSLGSFRQAIIIAFVGVGSVGMALFSLKVFGAIFGFMAIIGALGLVGIAINDSVMVLSGLNENAEAKAGDRKAIARVVNQSTRHVITTTITTIAGFVPLLISGGPFLAAFGHCDRRWASAALHSSRSTLFLLPTPLSTGLRRNNPYYASGSALDIRPKSAYSSIGRDH